MKWRLLIMFNVIVVLSLVLLPGCGGSPEEVEEIEADGVWCYTPHTTYDFQTADGFNDYLAKSFDGDWTGIFNGTSEEFGMIIHHSSNVGHFPGRELYIGTVSFDSVEVDGTSGGLEMYVSGEKLDSVSDWEGSWLITSGSDALKDLQGHGTWWGPGWQGNYSDCGVIHYAVEELDGL